MKWTLLAVRLTLGALLLYSGIAKFRQPYDFLATVYSYQLLGPKTGMIVAAGLPWLEMVVGGCLLAGMLHEGALVGAICLAAMFTVATGSAWHRGLSISCGCFGASNDIITGPIVLRAVGLLVLAGVGLIIASRFRQPLWLKGQ